ncbi:MAG: hypothetical protein WBZ36_23115, partial [Candidatus Nitrosopolaris sp.]
KKQRSTNIPSKVRFGSCIRLRGNSACNSRDREPLFLKLSRTNLEFADVLDSINVSGFLSPFYVYNFPY